MPKKITQEEFINRSKELHNNKYDYSLVIFKNTRSEVTIICPTHGAFKQKAMTHLRPRGCLKCGLDKMSSQHRDTIEQFIEKAMAVHGDKYDYSKVEYKNSSLKVTIVCPEHGEFFQSPNTHIMNHGCPLCGLKSRFLKITKSTEKFIEDAIKVHGDKYDYSQVEYRGYQYEVNIICKKHGLFFQKAELHLRGFSCIKCGREKSSSCQSHTLEKFIENARKNHGDKYDYSQTVYVNNRTKLKIICPEHGEFWQKPNKHLSKNGCIQCGVILSANAKYKDLNYFIEKANVVHLNKYDYSKSIYTRANKKLIIICPVHGEFEQSPNSHCKGSGCPVCKTSTGEREVRRYLLDNKIKFEAQKTFDNCRNIDLLPFDFYLSTYQTVIEFQGRQHYELVFWSKTITPEKAEEELNKVQKNDQIKKEWCEKNHIKLIYIHHEDKSKVSHILKENLL